MKNNYRIGSTEIVILLAITAAITIFLLTGCEKEPPPPPPPGDNYCTCAEATIVVSSAPKWVFTRLDSNAYGANNYFIYELDSTADGFVYKGTTELVEGKVLREDWDVPGSYLWAAGRAGTDGLDPYTPIIGDEFIYPYLPYSGGSATWSSNNNISNDKTTCPDNNHNNYWAPLCNGKDGKHQLDHLAPQLTEGNWYLVRMVMGYSVNDKFNVVSHCYQKVFKFETGVH
jgi:hypothetical protein